MDPCGRALRADDLDWRMSSSRAVMTAMAIVALTLIAGAWMAAGISEAKGGPSFKVTTYSKGITKGNVGPFPGPHSIFAGPDGNMWFGGGAGQIGKITSRGEVTEFTRGFARGMLTVDMAVGHDGAIWSVATIPGGSRGAIRRISTSGKITEFSAGIKANSGLSAITRGPDGNMWFSQGYEPQGMGGSPSGYANRIGRITPTGAITEFGAVFPPAPTSEKSPRGIATGSDGNLWYSKEGVIGRMTTDGIVTEFSGVGDPYGMTAGSDGNIWFADYGRKAIGRITPTGDIAFFKGSGGRSIGAPMEITLAPDGNLWFTGDMDRSIGRITPSGMVTRFRVARDGYVLGIAVARDGRVWFANYMEGEIGVLDLNSSATGHSRNAKCTKLKGKTRAQKRTKAACLQKAKAIGKKKPRKTGKNRR